MLNGLAPIIIFNFKKLLPALQDITSGIPLLSDVTGSIPLVPIPVYLDEKITGIYIDQENKNIDIETRAQTLPDGQTPKSQQSGINSLITVNMVGSKNSIGLSILIAMCDLIFEKVTSQEYSITYLHEAVTIFGGLLEGFSVQQSANTDLYSLSLQISKVTGGSTVEKVAPVTLSKATGVLPL
jgi:hypothetical protein